MNDMDLLKQDVEREFPDTLVKLDKNPSDANAPSFLYIERPGRQRVVIEWRPKEAKFHVSYGSRKDFGSGPNEIRIHRFSVMERIRELLN